MKKTLVVDLDGTLLTVNSFSKFCAWLLYHVMVGVLVARPIAKRKMRLISHAEAKQQILKIVESRLTELDADTFAKHILNYAVNNTVVDIINKSKAKDWTVLLATAAPAWYARKIAERLSFDGVVATPTGGLENNGEQKLINVKRWLCKHGSELGGVVTDHYDDLALMKQCVRDGAEVWLVAPSEKTLKIIRSHNIPFTLV